MSTLNKTQVERELDEMFNEENMKAAQEQLAKEEAELSANFWKQHDYFGKPSLQARQAGAWTREHILLDSWNRYINYSEKLSEFVGEYPKGKGFRVINQERRCDIALNFAHWFLTDMQSMVEAIDNKENNL
tara:strand:- start:32 stop:424 length:393 start_codon:yes stop_codon:yes gene_type:complete